MPDQWNQGMGQINQDLGGGAFGQFNAQRLAAGMSPVSFQEWQQMQQAGQIGAQQDQQGWLGPKQPTQTPFAGMSGQPTYNQPQQGNPFAAMWLKLMGQGQDAMQNLGSTIGQQFGATNLLNSSNINNVNQLNAAIQQAQIAAQAQVQAAQAAGNAGVRQQELASVTGPVKVAELGNQRLGSVLPAILAAFSGGIGGGGGGGGMLGGFTTPFGQSATLGSAAQRTNTAPYRTDPNAIGGRANSAQDYLFGQSPGTARNKGGLAQKLNKYAATSSYGSG